MVNVIVQGNGPQPFNVESPKIVRHTLKVFQRLLHF